MARYEFPTTAELLEMGEPRENAVTVYLPATAGDFELARTTVKSSMDEVIRTLRDRGASHGLQEAFAARTAEILADECWHKLSRSLAIFTTDETAEVFVLPNNLEHQIQVSRYFDLGQFLRAVATPQDAYALSLSGKEWNLWRASGTTRAHEIAVDHEGHNSVTHREEANADILDVYAKDIAGIVERELNNEDPTGLQPLFLFATDPLEGIFRKIGVGPRTIVRVPGGSDDLTVDGVDGAIRAGLEEINAQRAGETVDTLADGISKGLVATDLVDIARAAVGGAVDTLVYDFTIDILGRLDSATGAVEYFDDGYDLLSRIAVTVLANGGAVIPVRAADIDSDIWNGTAVARLRFPLSQ
ncbi:MAG: hypothetical protein EKK60_00550 [Gordonia sp. (in: high G+C Gram-positive bacteria)]|nr:MAG: hypothetical protein EKK60_00550 [Gordonia sp. (in: high G+C Gram-positive bacteria)]